MEAPFPFFVGCDRSGTTMIQAVFNAHSELAIPYESHFIAPLLLRRKRYERRDRFDLEGFAYDLLQFPFVERWGMTRDEVLAALADAAPTTTADAIRSVFELYAREEAKPRYGDKTPGYVRSIPPIAERFPEARFVHVVRDGRDVALSLLEVEWGPSKVHDAARFWKLRVDAGRSAGRALGPQRYLELRYEDFLHDMEATTKRVAEFLELTFEPSMLEYTVRAGAIIEQSDVPHRHQGLLEGPTPGKRDWRTQMEPSDVALFEAIAGTSLEELGYERSFERIPVSTRVRARWGLVTRKIRGIPDRIRVRRRLRARRLSKVT